MRTQQMADVVKSGWFGRKVNVLLSNGKKVSGELTQVSEHYIVLSSQTGEVQVMTHAIILIRPAGSPEGQ
jgi:sRNA-binding regulator protein Hfq